MLKKCNRCEEEKDTDTDWYKTENGKPSSYCKKCSTLFCQEYRFKKKPVHTIVYTLCDGNNLEIQYKGKCKITSVAIFDTTKTPPEFHK